MRRVRQVFVPYDKFNGQTDAAGRGIELDNLTYNTLEKSVTNVTLLHIRMFFYYIGGNPPLFQSRIKYEIETLFGYLRKNTMLSNQ